MNDPVFHQLHLTGLGRTGAQDGIIPRQSAQAMAVSRDIIAEAHARAEAIIADAEAAQEAARVRGHAEGLAQAARDAAARQLADEARLQLALDRLEGEMADLVTDCLRRIVSELDAGDLARATLREALAVMRREKRAQLHVSSAAHDAIRQALPAILADFPEIELVDLVMDPGISSPDLRLESTLGVVEFSMEATLEDLRRLLGGS